MQNQTHKVAIITCTYDRIAELERAIKSVDNQIYPYWKHYIVVDGNKATVKYLKKRKDKYIESGQRVIVEIPPKERYNDWGATPLNKGLEQSKEEYYCVLADDNLFKPNHLACLIPFMERHKDLYDFVWGNTEIRHKSMAEYYQIRSWGKPQWNAIDLGEPIYKKKLWDESDGYKYVDRPDLGDTKDRGCPGNKYSYDWHHIHDCLKRGARYCHVAGLTPTFIWFAEDKAISSKELKHDGLWITAFPAGDGGCAYYRLRYPLQEIERRNKKIDVKFFDTNKSIFQTEVLFRNSDVIIFQAIIGENVARQMLKLRAMGKIVIYEVDDNIFGILWDNHNYQKLGIKECKWKFNNKEAALRQLEIFKYELKKNKKPFEFLEKNIEKVKKSDSKDFYIDLWKDGRDGFDLKKNYKTVHDYQNCLRAATAVTCTTSELAEVIRPYNNNVKTFDNYLDLDVWRNDLTYREKKDKEIRIVWQGGSSHYTDLMLVRDALVKVLEKNEQCKLVLMGFHPEGVKKVFPEDRIEIVPWCNFLEYPYRFHRLMPDIGIIPLVDNDFNRAKSPIKWEEMSALEIPTVCSDICVYNRVVEHGETGFLFKNEKEILFYLQKLIDFPELRKEIGGKARAFVEEHFDIKKKSPELLTFYEELWLRENMKISSRNTLLPKMMKKWGLKPGSRKAREFMNNKQVKIYR